MIDARSVARALGGEVTGRDAVSAPGPNHSRKDRSLSIRIDPTAPDGFLIYSHANDDWRECRDYVRRKLGLPDWQPGDGQDRRVPPQRIKEFDRAAADREAEKRQRTEEDHERIKRAVELWSGGNDPRGSVAEKYLASRCLELPADM